jgi:hypothetical protein
MDFTGSEWSPVVEHYEYSNEPFGSIKGRHLMSHYAVAFKAMNRLFSYKKVR